MMAEALLRSSLYLVPLIPVIGGLLVALVGWSSAPLRRWLTVFVLLANLVYVLPMAAPAPALSASLGALSIAGQRLDVALRLDGLGGMLLLFVAVCGLLIAAYDALDPTACSQSNRMKVAMLFAIAAANGALVAADLLLLYSCLMLSSMFVGFLLLGESRAVTRQAGFKLFAMLEIPGLALPATIIAALGNGGTIDLAQPLRFGGSAVLGSLVLLAIVVRVGLVPFHTWFLDAVEPATGRSGALVALLGMPLGAYLLLRLGPSLAGSGFPLAAVLLVLGSVTLLVAAYRGLRQGSAGQVVAAVTLAPGGCLALAYASAGALSVEAALAQLVATFLLAPLSFIALDALSRDREADRLSDSAAGMARRPYAGLLFALALLAAAGLPPFYGFAARSYVLQTLLASGAMAWLSAAILLVASAALLGAVANLIARLFLSEAVVEARRWWQEERASAVGLTLVALPAIVLVLFPTLHRAIVGEAIDGPAGVATWSGMASGAVFLLALFAGAWPFLGSEKLARAPALAIALQPRLRAVSLAVERLSVFGSLDPYRVAAYVFLGIARGTALVVEAVFDRLAI